MLEDIKHCILAGDIDNAPELVKQALEAGTTAGSILDEALITAMDVVGREYESGARYVPEMLISAEAMKAAMTVLKPHLVEAGVKMRGKVVIGTVEGDLHDIGKNLVGMMLEGAGFEVHDLGTEVSAANFSQAVKGHEPCLLGMSALLTTTMIHMPEVIQSLANEGIRGKIKVMVGGAPVTQEFADKIGADAYAPDAPGAVEAAKRLVAHT